MKIYIGIIVIIIIVLLLSFWTLPTVEGFGGRRNNMKNKRARKRGIRHNMSHLINAGSKGRIHNRNGGHGNRYNTNYITSGSGRGGWTGGYLDRFRRRNDGWYGNYSTYWNNYFIPSMYDYWLEPPCNCKRGCTPEGCSYPGNGIDDCVWATDCNCCGF